jgi:hypothetical protein
VGLEKLKVTVAVIVWPAFTCTAGERSAEVKVDVEVEFEAEQALGETVESKAGVMTVPGAGKVLLGRQKDWPVPTTVICVVAPAYAVPVRVNEVK